MNKKVVLVGSIGLVFLLFFCNFNSGVNAKTIIKNEQQVNFFQYFKEKIENDDWKLMDFLDGKLLKDAIENSGWFPGYFIFTTILGVIALIMLILTAGHPS